MEKLKLIIRHGMMISFGILAGISIQGVVFRTSIHFAWYHPLSIVIGGMLCALPTLLFLTDKKLSKAMQRVRTVLHFLLLMLMVVGMGYIFHWYDTPSGALVIVADYVFVYVFVTIVSAWTGMWEQKSINKALDSIRDEE